MIVALVTLLWYNIFTFAKAVQLISTKVNLAIIQNKSRNH